jgi:hypothetical protein
MAIDHKFADTLNGLFNRIFREGTSALHSPKAAEAMRKSTDLLAKEIDAKINAVANGLIKKLQAGVVRGFNLLEADNKKMEKKIDALRRRVLALEKLNK